MHSRLDAVARVLVVVVLLAWAVRESRIALAGASVALVWLGWKLDGFERLMEEPPAG